MPATNIYTLPTEGEIKARAQERKHRMDYQRLRKVDRLERELEAARSGQGIRHPCNRRGHARSSDSSASSKPRRAVRASRSNG